MIPSRYRLPVLLVLSGAALFWERLWPRLWPAAVIGGAFLALALLDVLPLLPSWLHAIALLTFALALAAALWWARSAFRWPGNAVAQRRLERDSGLDHRPLAASGDRLASGGSDPLAETLWRRHLQQMAARLGRLRLNWPRSQIERAEPWGIRAGVVLLLFVGIAAGWHDPGHRIARAVNPGLGFAAQQAPLVEMWISPPAYTRSPPQFLSSASPDTGSPGTGRSRSDGASGGLGAPVDAATAQEIIVPQGSTVLARVTGVDREPALVVGDDAMPMPALDEQRSPRRAFAAETTVRAGDRLAVVTGGQTLVEWHMRTLPDQPPAIVLTTPPEKAGNGLLNLKFSAADDYGVKSAKAIITRAGESEAIDLDLPLAAADPTVITGEVSEDLSAHRWAGETVNLTLDAKDDLGQTGRSDEISFVLPERQFHHPVARAIVAARKRLITDDPLTRRSVVNELNVIASRPDTFDGDVVVALALAVAKARLSLDVGAGAIDSVRDLLWSTALRLEEGDVPAAERALAEARQKLKDALARDAPLAEIERRMDDLQAALQRYLQALASQMAQQSRSPQQLDPRLMAMPKADLSEMLDAARQMMRAGARDAAERMLAELQRMLDQLRAGMPMAGLPPAMVEAQSLLDKLNQLKDSQQGLLDQTFERLRELRDRLGQPGHGRPSTGSGSASGAEAQQQLRSDLADLIERIQRLLGSAPGELSEADQAMRSAGRALGEGRLGEGVNRQGQAVDALGRALDALGQQLTKALGTGNMIILGTGSQPGGGRGDAFGRNSPGGRRGSAVGDIPIPDASSLRRAAEILQELRRRAGEPSRPPIEQDYIKRMLRQF